MSPMMSIGPSKSLSTSLVLIIAHVRIPRAATMQVHPDYNQSRSMMKKNLRSKLWYMFLALLSLS